MGAGDIDVTPEAIEAAYAASGNTLGWRLLASPASTLASAEIAFVGLNPAGHFEPAGHPRFAVSAGSAYSDECWGMSPPGQSPLQRQVLALFECLRADPETVLAGNLVPFRSPSWATLRGQKKSLEYGYELWQKILSRARPRLIIAMGCEAAKTLRKIVGAHDEMRVPVGWGKVTGSRSVFPEGVLVGLPHLSRFSIIGRPQSECGLATLFGSEWRK